jgi:hypothetical protein
MINSFKVDFSCRIDLIFFSPLSLSVVLTVFKIYLVLYIFYVICQMIYTFSCLEPSYYRLNPTHTHTKNRFAFFLSYSLLAYRLCSGDSFLEDLSVYIYIYICLTLFTTNHKLFLYIYLSIYI